MLAVALMVISAGIIFALGVLHLVYTFYGNKLTPRDSALQTRMAEVSPVISRRTTMWKTWIGFNASHSMGALLFGLVYGYLALAHSALLFNSAFLLGVGLLMLGGWVVLGKRYWFSAPLQGIGIALVLYVAAVVLARA